MQNGSRANLLVDGRIREADLKHQFEENGLTIQFYQPQRFSDPLWYLQRDFENVFGCLAGKKNIGVANNVGISLIQKAPICAKQAPRRI